MSDIQNTDYLLVNRDETSYKITFDELSKNWTKVPGPVGPQGPRGIQGPVGPEGIQGPIGDTGEAGMGIQMRAVTACTSENQINGGCEVHTTYTGNGAGGPPDGTNNFDNGGFINGDTVIVQNGIKGDFPGCNETGQDIPDGSFFTWIADDSSQIGIITPGEWKYMGQFASVPGPTGATGVGATGATGVQGIQGIQGPIGLTGPKGDKGDKGEQGIQGPVGPEGTMKIENLIAGDGIQIQSVPDGGGGMVEEVSLKPAQTTEIGGFVEPNSDSKYYARYNGTWAEVASGSYATPLYLDTSDNTAKLNYDVAKGLEVVNGKLAVNIGTGLEFSDDPNVPGQKLISATGGGNPPEDSGTGDTFYTIQYYTPIYMRFDTDGIDNNSDHYNVYTDSETSGGRRLESMQVEFYLPKKCNGCTVNAVWRTTVGPNDRQNYGGSTDLRGGVAQYKNGYELLNIPGQRGSFTIPTSGSNNQGSILGGQSFTHVASNGPGQFTRFMVEAYDTRLDMWSFNALNDGDSNEKFKMRIYLEPRQRKSSRIKGMLGGRVIIQPFAKIN